MSLSFPNQKGFTLIELMVVISIIGTLSTIALTSLNGARAKARDARRFSDMEQIRTALEVYRAMNGHYPDNTDYDDDYGGWDIGYRGGAEGSDTFIQPLVDAGLLAKVSGDPAGTTGADSYLYYRYNAGGGGCDASRGDFYVLGVRNLEGGSGISPRSPGWNCPARDWREEFEWVTGNFTN
jgi:prepilin-type N-terminal cleavage/methylation domain-containing protein